MVEDLQDQDYSVKKGYEGLTKLVLPTISGGIGLGAAVDYLSKVGIERIHDHERRLTKRLLEGLQEMEGVTVFGPLNLDKHGGVVSFGVCGLLPHEVAMMLDQASNISVRSGHHCCIPLMRYLGLKYGTVRASLYLYNTEEEVDKILAVLEQIVRMA